MRNIPCACSTSESPRFQRNRRVRGAAGEPGGAGRVVCGEPRRRFVLALLLQPVSSPASTHSRKLLNRSYFDASWRDRRLRSAEVLEICCILVVMQQIYPAIALAAGPACQTALRSDGTVRGR
jgi:hypothetical protein